MIVLANDFARCTGNTVFECFPLFYLENIGCYKWGFVAEKHQAYEPMRHTNPGMKMTKSTY